MQRCKKQKIVSKISKALQVRSTAGSLQLRRSKNSISSSYILKENKTTEERKQKHLASYTVPD